MLLKNISRKPKDPLAVQVGGKLSTLMLGNSSPTEYNDPGNPTITIQMGKSVIPNTLVDINTTINIMTKETLEKLGIANLGSNPTILELDDWSIIFPKGIVYDVIITLDSMEYPTDFLVL